MTDKLPARIADHPTVRKVRGRHTEPPGVIEADWLRAMCLEAGEDVIEPYLEDRKGFVKLVLKPLQDSGGDALRAS